MANQWSHDPGRRHLRPSRGIDALVHQLQPSARLQHLPLPRLCEMAVPPGFRGLLHSGADVSAGRTDPGLRSHCPVYAASFASPLNWSDGSGAMIIGDGTMIEVRSQYGCRTTATFETAPRVSPDRCARRSAHNRRHAASDSHSARPGPFLRNVRRSIRTCLADHHPMGRRRDDGP